MDVWVWAGLVGFILLLLALDLFVFHRDAHEVSMREAALLSAFYLAIGFGFALLLAVTRGADDAGDYLAGYLIEKSLSLDNVFVFALIFGYFAIPPAYQHRVLFWGVIGAVAFRAGFIAAGVALLDQIHWIVYVMGAFLILTGIRLARHRDIEVHPERNIVIRLLGRVMPVSRELHGQRLVVRKAGVLTATPLLAALVAVETTDVIFAIDSIPAIFAITTDTFIVFAANAFAILGLRALYFLLAGTIKRFEYLQIGLAVLLVLAGGKLILSDHYKVPVAISLPTIALVIGVAVAASLVAARRRRAARPGEPLAASGGGRVAVVQHQGIAVRVGEEGHVADAGVEDVPRERDPA